MTKSRTIADEEATQNRTKPEGCKPSIVKTSESHNSKLTPSLTNAPHATSRSRDDFNVKQLLYATAKS